MASIQKRVTREGAVHYRAQVRRKGFPPASKTFPTRREASEWISVQEALIRRGLYLHTREAERHTLRDLIQRYKTEVLPKKGSQRRNQRSQLDWWEARMGDYLLSAITPALLAEHREKLIREPNAAGRIRSPATANRYVAVLSHALNLAAKEWGWLEDSPMRKVARHKEPRGRGRWLSRDEQDAQGRVIPGELTRLLKACRESRNPHLHAAVVVSVATGMRQGELLGLRRSDVDWQAGRIILHTTKNGERRSVPLTGYALEVLRDHAKVRRMDTDLLFPGRNPKRPADLRPAFVAALAKAGIKDFHWHDLRHTAASYLAMNGASMMEIAAVLGHKTMQMVWRYVHLSKNHTTTVVDRMNQAIFGDRA